MPDTDFDPLAERFERRIQGSAKGRLRNAMLWRHIEQDLPGLNDSGKCCLDIGGGLGKMSENLARLGHEVVLVDPSMAMLERARERLKAYPNIRCLHQNLSAHAEAQAGYYDIVVCHAVLEWLEEPRSALPYLWRSMKPGGVLALAFYNVEALALGNMVKGNFRKLMRRDFSGDPGSLTPPNPLSPYEVYDWVAQCGFETLSCRGVRFAGDLLRAQLAASRSDEDIIALEWEYGGRPPFRELGRYIQLIVRRPPS